MTDRAEVLKAIRTPAILITIIATFLVLVIWLVVFFLPWNSKVSKLNAQQQQLTAEQQSLNHKLKSLEHLKNSNLSQLHDLYSGLLPTATDTDQYLKLINSTVVASGAKLLSFTIGTPSSGTGVVALPVTLSALGTYDQQLKLIQLLYQASRLTVITAVNLTGGGPTTTRSTKLTGSYTMSIYEVAGSTTNPH